MRRAFTRWVLPVAIAAVSSAVGAQTVNEVAPFLPEDGAVTGTRPLFRVEVDGTEVIKMRFKIELSLDDFRTIALTFDGKQDRAGWGLVVPEDDEDHPGAIHMLRKPLPGGAYKWRVWAWNGLEWIQGDDEFELTVDAIPPARVNGLRLGIDRETSKVTLQWSPVFADALGNGEIVAFYNVYRAGYPSFEAYRAFQIGQVEGTTFGEESELNRGLTFYRVMAEDSVGNWGRFRPPPEKVKVLRGSFAQRGQLSSEDE